MKFWIVAFILFFISIHVYAQVEQTNATERQLESSTANDEDVETEDDSYLQQLQQYLKDPIDLNSVEADELKELKMLTPLQVEQFILYRAWVGKFIDVYELQAVPGWDLQTIHKVRPYITAGIKIDGAASLKERLKKGEHTILLRASQVLERSKGYLPGTSDSANFYAGSPQKILLRYQYAYKNSLQYGIVAEKDPGEQFFKGKQKLGFDFYSAHFFLRNTGMIRSLAIGDFTVNMGQGLLQWQSLAFKKGADVINIKRESAVLRPYHSAGEINFHRGAGITLEKKAMQVSFFASYRKIDANFVSDTMQNGYDHISSLQTSGYHRTKSETDDKGIQSQLAFGGNISYRYKKMHLGLNGIWYRFKLPLEKTADPYNQYAFTGKKLGNYSFDYSYTYRNFHFFGEAAFTLESDRALINGLMASVSSFVDVSLLYRNISRSYKSLYSSAFTENSLPANESGIYTGISIRPSAFFCVDAYADFYKFPWLKYRLDAPSSGSDYLVQFAYRPDKKLEIYFRYHAESSAVNINLWRLHFPVVLQQPRKNWRMQVSYQLNREITLRHRNEILWFDKNGPQAGNGYLVFFDIIFKPALKPFSGNLRLQYFETDGYNNRLYAYESDVLYSYSIPVFYDKGYRYYININYDFTKRFSLWARWSQTIYPGKNLIGSGLDEILSNHKSDFKLQALYKF